MTFRIVNSINETSPADWQRLMGPSVIEGYGFHKTLEEAGLTEFTMRYLRAEHHGRVTALIPFFLTDFSFTTLVQGPLQRLIVRLQQRSPRFLRMKMLFVGAPAAEQLYLGIDPAEDFEMLMRGALACLHAFAEQQRVSASLFCNLTRADARLAALLAREGFSAMESFPGTVITLDAPSFEAYVQSLGASTRKDVRRKLRAAALANLRTEVTDSVQGILDDVVRLYRHNLEDSDVSFERLTPEFFEGVCRNMPGTAKYFLTRDTHGALVAFNLCFIQGDTCIDKFVGFDRSVAHRYHLYHATLSHNIAWCISHGIRFYHLGMTDYHPKLRLGAKLTPLQVYVRMRHPLLRFFTPLLVKAAAPKNFDPCLR